MRMPATLLLLLIVGCGRSDMPEVSDSQSAGAHPTSMSGAQRQATEDSARAWLAMVHDQMEHGDSAALMASYPPSGPLVSAGDGKLVTNRDSVASMLAGLSQVKGAKVTFDDPKVEVLAPGVAAVAVPSRFQGTNQGQAFDNYSVYTAVLAERDGRMRVIQEHQSTAPKPKK